MLYRPCTPADFDALYALEEACFKPPFRFDRRYMRSLVQRVNAATWVAEEDGRMAGFAIAGWTPRKQGTEAYIETIEVAPEQRGRGIGRALLGRIERSAREAGAELIWLHVEAGNWSAIRLYEAQGYRCEGREEHFYPLGRTGLVYAKRLDSTQPNQ